MGSRFGQIISLSLLPIFTTGPAALAISGCGGPAPPAEPDAQAPMPPDAMEDVCSCEGVAALAARITHRTHVEESGVVGLGVACDDPSVMQDWGELVGGGGVVQPDSPEDDVALVQLGVDLTDIPSLGEEQVPWWGRIHSRAPDPNRLMTITAACIDTSVDDSLACARQLDVSRALAPAAIPVSGVLDTSARCTRGVLVGGGCSFDSSHGAFPPRLLRAGMDPADPDAWLCSWRSDNPNEEIEVVAQAFCLDETISEECNCCSPVSDAIAVKHETQPLGPGVNQVQASCAEGERLLLGNCMLDNVETAALASVSILGSDVSPSEDNTWVCSWNNPDAVPATAIATALCIAE